MARSAGGRRSGPGLRWLLSQGGTAESANASSVLSRGLGGEDRRVRRGRPYVRGWRDVRSPPAPVGGRLTRRPPGQRSSITTSGLVVGRCHRCPLTPPRFATALAPEGAAQSRHRCAERWTGAAGVTAPLPPDGLVPTRRTCMSMPGANSVMAFAGIRVLDGNPRHNSQKWLKGTFTG